MTPDSILQRGAETAQAEVERVVAETASEAQVDLGVAHSHIATHLIRWLKRGFSAATDARTTSWRVRVRLYDQRSPSDPAADSDSELPPDVPGHAVLRGLPGVADHVAGLATDWHGSMTHGEVKGLDGPTLRHRLKSLRPTLSRRGGNAVWRVPYTVAGADWLARVDIQKVET